MAEIVSIQKAEQRQNPLFALKQVIKEVKLDEQGKAYFPIRAVARICGVDVQKVHYHLQLVSKSNPSKLGQKLIKAGFEGVKDSILDKHVSIILHFFAYESSSPSAEAKALCEALAATSLRIFAQNTLGFGKRNSITAVEPSKPFVKAEAVNPTIMVWNWRAAMDEIEDLKFEEIQLKQRLGEVERQLEKRRAQIKLHNEILELETARHGH